jgi:ankyrin repeat protein
MEAVFEAVLGDSGGLKRLLAEEPEAAHARRQEDFLIEGVHWLYTGDTPLHLAAAAVRPSVVEALLERGADPNARNRRGATPLHYACDPRPAASRQWQAEQQVDVIRLLVAHGAAIDVQDKGGVTALHRAVRARSPSAVRALLEAGAAADGASNKGSTPLHLAAQSTGAGGTAGAEVEQIEIIRLLREHGADPSVNDLRGRSALDWSVNQRVREALSTT